MKDSHSRSFVKGVTWRMTGTMDTMVIAYFVTGNISHSLKIGLAEVCTKIFLYYLHERVWNIIPWGRISLGPNPGPTHGRSLVKGISWRITGTLDTIFWSYIITGHAPNAFIIGGTEVFTKIFLFYLHERIWALVKWGRVFVDVEDNKLAEA